MVSQKAFHSAIIHTVLGKGLQHEDVAFNALANAWICVILTIYNVANGMTVVLPNGSFEINRFSHFVEKYKITSAVLVPVMMQWLITEIDKVNYNLSSLRLLIYGSAPAAPSLLRNARETSHS